MLFLFDYLVWWICMKKYFRKLAYLYSLCLLRRELFPSMINGDFILVFTCLYVVYVLNWLGLCTLVNYFKFFWASISMCKVVMIRYLRPLRILYIYKWQLFNFVIPKWKRKSLTQHIVRTVSEEVGSCQINCSTNKMEPFWPRFSAWILTRF